MVELVPAAERHEHATVTTAMKRRKGLRTIGWRKSICANCRQRMWLGVKHTCSMWASIGITGDR